MGSWSGECGELDAELNVPLLDVLLDAVSGSELASTKYSLAVESKVESSRRQAEREGEEREGEVVWGAMRVRRVGRTRVGKVVSRGMLWLGESGVDMAPAEVCGS